MTYEEKINKLIAFFKVTISDKNALGYKNGADLNLEYEKLRSKLGESFSKMLITKEEYDYISSILNDVYNKFMRDNSERRLEGKIR